MTDDPKLAAVLRPGDRCLITLAQRDIDVDEVELMRGQLVERFPDVEFTFLSGATGLAVLGATCECGPNTRCMKHAMAPEVDL